MIIKETQPTDWVNRIVYNRKSNGRLWICLDPKDFNKAIKCCHHTTPMLEELSHIIKDCTDFFKLDARSGYWSVKLDHASSLLTTFQVPQNAIGLKMSQNVFQHKIDMIIEACKGCVVSIADDIAVTGIDQTDHNNHLHEFQLMVLYLMQTSVKLASHPSPSLVSSMMLLGSTLIQTRSEALSQFPHQLPSKNCKNSLESPHTWPHLSQTCLSRQPFARTAEQRQ